jgi:hypothetical protein
MSNRLQRSRCPQIGVAEELIDSSTLPWYSRRSHEGLASLTWSSETVSLHAIAALSGEELERMAWLRSLYRHP